MLRIDPHPAHGDDGNAVAPQFEFLQQTVILLLSCSFVLVPDVVVADFMSHDGLKFIGVEKVERLSRD